MNFDTLTAILVAIGGGIVLWWGAIYLGRFLSWIERSEIARQNAEAATAQGRKASASRPAPATGPRTGPRTDPGSGPETGPGAIPAAHVAAIAAAIGAIGGAHAIVHVAVSGTTSAWAAEGRWLQQTSHRPH